MSVCIPQRKPTHCLSARQTRFKPGDKLSNLLGESSFFYDVTYALFVYFCPYCPTGYAIPAVNCVSSSSINACLEAARKNDAPIIIQFSSGGSQVSA